ncbi:hypothetical protein TELCIR_06415 [Teladorsagia circumcincta]|uniref:Uncharacterized protein n=1 Tax=Teladorsagia circumcincta TaxID=45464 RepID=A0A2G9UN05_TELCI|nr:hypothetical protein TELCIR_06415 [Teladorsagia circumcincta]
MAAITPNYGTSVDSLLTLLYEKFTKALPAYAMPCFVRITKDIEKTGTFKMKKATLQLLGLAGSTTSTVYYLDHQKKTFSMLNDSIIAELEKGRRKL